jgi:hypothetical protein
MNLTTSIESAFYDLIRKQDLGVKPPLVRCWHNLKKDNTWDWTIDRVLPCIDIRCSPFVPGDDARTGSCRVSLRAKSNGSEDKDHATISAIEEGLQSFIDGLYGDLYSGNLSGAFGKFATAVKAECATVQTIGGLTIEQGDEPSEEDGDPIVGFVIVVSITKTEY